MSWPQWPGGQPGIVQPPVINPAPNVVNPSANQYTPEQWAQMQHQNWQQWAQWQQQFQQWQQQYGAEYQKSMNAIAQASMPPQVSVPFVPAPPLPAENKPPPPPDEPIGPPSQSSNAPFAMNMPPPPASQSNYNTAPPPPQPPTMKPGFDNKYSTYRGNAPPTQGAFPNQDINNQQRYPRNQNYNARDPQGQNANWHNQNRNQQGMNRYNQSLPRGPQFENKPEAGTKRPYFNPNDNDNTKRNKMDLNEGNKWGGNQQQQQHKREEPLKAPPQQKPPTVTQAKSNPEELSEAEKKFDKQFNDWEAQFQKWKQQNANHPDKEQYRQYEKKWETWRAQLLERREQMKRKRLGLSATSPQQQSAPNKPDQEQLTKNLTQPPVISNTNTEAAPTAINPLVSSKPETAEKLEVDEDVPAIRPPPNLNNQPLEFKKSGINVIESSDQEKENNKEMLKSDDGKNDFLKSAASDGIPGLDLVKEGNDTEEMEDADGKKNENTKPDLEAISRGINSILGDQKLLNMLSIVSQNQTKTQQPPPKMDSPKFSPAEYVQEENEYSNEEHDEYFNFEGPSSHETPGNLARFDSQKDGENDYYNEEGSNSFEDSAHFSKGPDNLHQFSGSGPRNLDKQNFNRNQNFMQDPNRESFNRGPGFGNSANFNRMGDNYDQSDRDFDNLSQGNFNKSRNPPSLVREPNQLNRGSDNFSQDADDFNRPPSSFNKGPDGFNRGSDNFNNFNRGPKSADNYNRAPDFNRGSDNFNRGPDNFNRGPDNFNRGPNNFNRGPDNFSRGSEKFNRAPGNFNRGPDNFSRGPDNFNRGPDNFNRTPANFRVHDNFNRGPDNFNRGPGGFNRGTDNFNRGPESFNRGPDSFNRGSENFSRPSDAFNRGPANFRGSDNFSRSNERGPDDISRDAEDLSKDPDNYQSDADNFDEESESFGDADNFDRAPDTFNRGFDNFNRDGDKFTTSTPDNFNRGPDKFGRPSDNFSRGPDNFNRPGNFNRGPDNFGRGPDNFSRVPNNFNRDGRNVDNFNKAPENINRSFENSSRNFDNFNRAPPTLDKGQIRLGRGSVDFNREADEFGRTTSFNREFGNFDKNLDDNFSSGPENFSSRVSANRPTLQSNRDRDIGSFDDYKKHSVVSPGNFDKGPNNFARGLTPFIKKPEDSSFNQNKPFNVKEDEFETKSWKNNISRNESTCDAKLDTKLNVSGINDDCDSNTFGKNSEDLNVGPTKRDVNAELQFEHPNSIRGTSPIAPIPEKLQTQSEGEGMWKTSNVIDYGHKSLAEEPEIILEVYYTFDYRHKPLNRIPYPSRPKWLSDMVEKYPEFGVVRNARHDSRKYPSNEKFDTYNMYDDRGKIPYDDWSRRSVGDREKYTDRDRKFNEDRKRKSYDNREHFIYEERQVKEYRSDKNRRGFDRDGGILNEEKDKTFEESGKSHNFDEQKSTDSKPSFSKGDHFDDEDDFDNEDNFSSNSKHSESVNFGSDKQNKPKHTNKNTTPSTAAKSNITSIEDILTPPGRYNRPPRIVIILRGPPGSGKSFLAKLIKDKEVESGGSAPRILCLDDYFMVEQEKEVEEDGRKTKIKEMVYEYEEDMEASYRQSLMKSFKKTITDGYFTFIIVDNINDKVKYFGEMWSFAKQNGFQVYISQMELDVQICTKRNIHGRTETEIEKCVAGWEQTPTHHPVLDATSLIQSGSIPEVEMEEINSPSSDNMNEEDRLISSKWDTFDYSVDNLAKLDGTNKPLRTSRTMEDYLQLDDDWIQPVSTKPGQKRVRWADLEERKEQEKMRAIGFVVGQTNWDRMMDPTMGGSALTQTKYIERYSKY